MFKAFASQKQEKLRFSAIFAFAKFGLIWTPV
jgi:hypothetical protein